MKLATVITFVLGFQILLANPYKFEKEVDLIEVANNQANLSENILENYFQQDYIEVNKQLITDIEAFEANLNILLQSATKEFKAMSSTIKENIHLWNEFKQIVSAPFDEAQTEKVIQISEKLLLANENLAIIAQKKYIEVLN